MDTLSVGGKPCVDLAFVPFNSESFGFTGHLYVMLDSTYFVHRAVLNLPKKINLNFVDYMAVEQHFDRAPDGTRQLMSESITTELKLVDNSDGLYARRDVHYRNYRFELTDSARLAFDRPERQIEDRSAMLRDDAYWASERGVEVNEKETSVDKLMRQLRSRPMYYWTEKILKIAFTGYVSIPREENPLFYYGPVNTSFNGNALEGFRVRVGGMTTAGIHPHLFVRGYGAYGFDDRRWKGLGELEYSFHPKKDYANEFPIHSLRMSYYNDVNQYGQNYLYTSKDNMFLALKRKKDDRIGYIRKIEGTYTHEYHSGFSVKLTGRHRREEASHLIPFVRQDGSVVKDFQTTELELKLRYSPARNSTRRNGTGSAYRKTLPYSRSSIRWG